MSKQLSIKRKNTLVILLVLFGLISMTAIIVSAQSSVQDDNSLQDNAVLPLMNGGEFVKVELASPNQGPDWQEYLPRSSIEKPEDVGKAAHTNLRILIPPNNTVINPVSHDEAVKNLNFFDKKDSVNPAIFPSYVNTPSSIACIYQQVAQPATQPSGCNPQITTVPPSGGGGAIAIVDAYDTPSAPKDMINFSTYFDLPAANFTVIYAGNASTSTGNKWPYTNGPQPPTGVGTGWDLETALDIEWAHAMAPNARIFLVEAQSNFNKDLYPAVQAAQYLVSHNGGGEISMSWGGTDNSGETSLDPIFNNASLSNVVHLASSGDTGGVVIYPSASPYVFSVGGTTINRDANGNFVNETSWTSGGSGKSKYETRPSFQNSVQTVVGSQRGTPDFSMDANPSSGVAVTLAGTWHLVGGTSVSAPMSAGIFNVANAVNPNVVNVIFNALYNNGLDAAAFRDIASPTCGSGKGYNLCTGWGSLLGYGASQKYSDMARF
jgi:subtilase family serine protease